jgi:hypothetical protein
MSYINNKNNDLIIRITRFQINRLNPIHLHITQQFPFELALEILNSTGIKNNIKSIFFIIVDRYFLDDYACLLYTSDAADDHH